MSYPGLSHINQPQPSLTGREGHITFLGLIVPAFHAFHSSVLMLGLSDQLTLSGTALFFLWFVATGVYLVRRS